MKILLVAATNQELDGIRSKVSRNPDEFPDLEFLNTGVGMVASTYALSKALLKKSYDLVLNVGLAGTLNDEHKLGDVYEIYQDEFADLGAEDGEEILSLFQMKLANENQAPFKEGKLYASYKQGIGSKHALKKAKGISVNLTHGNQKSIEKLELKHKGKVESMEGAAIFYVSIQEKVDCMQIRAISNRVEVRNRENWQIETALTNLAHELEIFLKQLK